MEVSSPSEGTASRLMLSLKNKHEKHAHTALITHHAYGFANQTKTIQPGLASEIALDLSRSYGWYDFSVRLEGFNRFERRYAGHVETGVPSFSDPHMGGVVL